MVGWFNERAREPLAAVVCKAATPFSIAVHAVVYLAWWASRIAEPGLMIALSLEAIIIGLVIIDKQNEDAARDHEWQKRAFTELLDKLPRADPQVAETD